MIFRTLRSAENNHALVLKRYLKARDLGSAENPNVDFIKPCNLGPHMKRITLDNILTSLETLEPRVEIDPKVAAKARTAVERMVRWVRP
jgi:quinolinate synthase